MRNLSIRIAGCFLVLTALIWTLGCGPSATNTNVAENRSANTALANTTPAPTPNPACGGTLEEKRQKVEDEIKRLIGADPQLGEQYRSGAFDFQVVIVNKYLEAHFKGLIVGKNELDDLSKILSTFKEDQCLLMVRMASKNAGTGSVPSVPLAGFEWNMCEWPTFPCPDGTCHESCRPGGTANGNGNANANANANANTPADPNMNRNTNANASTSTNSSNVNR